MVCLSVRSCTWRVLKWIFWKWPNRCKLVGARILLSLAFSKNSSFHLKKEKSFRHLKPGVRFEGWEDGVGEKRKHLLVIPPLWWGQLCKCVWAWPFDLFPQDCGVPEVEFCLAAGGTEALPICIQSAVANLEELDVEKNPYIKVKSGVWVLDLFNSNLPAVRRRRNIMGWKSVSNRNNIWEVLL